MSMATKALKEIIERVERWPQDRQEDARASCAIWKSRMRVHIA